MSDAQGTARPVIIATRSSELALRQAQMVRDALLARGVAAELKTYTTVGDKRLEVALSAIGSKGLFTQELEGDLVNGTADCAVHSCKDLPTENPPGLEVIALLPREDARDVLVLGPRAKGATSLATLPQGAVVGTSSLRRRAQLLAQRPDLTVVEHRGNVGTRIRKVQEGVVDAALLAAAGMHRLGRQQEIGFYLDVPDWLPAAAQGAIAVQVRAGDARMRAMIGALNDAPTMLAVRAERAFLAALEGGCQVPIGASARTEGEGLVLYGLIAGLKGERVLRGSLRVDAAGPEAAGRALAQALRDQGAGEILREVRAATVPAPK